MRGSYKLVLAYVIIPDALEECLSRRRVYRRTDLCGDVGGKGTRGQGGGICGDRGTEGPLLPFLRPPEGNLRSAPSHSVSVKLFNKCRSFFHGSKGRKSSFLRQVSRWLLENAGVSLFERILLCAKIDFKFRFVGFGGRICFRHKNINSNNNVSSKY